VCSEGRGGAAQAAGKVLNDVLEPCPRGRAESWVRKGDGLRRGKSLRTESQGAFTGGEGRTGSNSLLSRSNRKRAKDGCMGRGATRLGLRKAS